MKLKDLFEGGKAALKEQLIGREIEILDEKVLLLGLRQTEETEDGEAQAVTKLLLLYQEELEEEDWDDDWDEEDEWDEEWDRDQTNRQMLIEALEDESQAAISDVDTFIIGGMRFETLGMDVIDLSERPYDEVLMLKRFAEDGAIAELWMDKQVKTLVLAEFEVDSSIFDVDWNADILPVSVEMMVPNEEGLVGKVMECSCGLYEKPMEFTIKGRDGEPIEVTLYGVYPFDIWKDAACLEDDFYELEEECGRDERLLMAEYSTRPEVQLNFYTRDYLDGIAYEDEGPIGFWIVGPKEDGHRKCVIDVVPEDFDEDVEIELLSYVKLEEE